jgi:hypothetical protein
VTAKPVAGPTDVEELRRREELEKKKREIAEMRERKQVAREEFEAEMDMGM